MEITEKEKARIIAEKKNTNSLVSLIGFAAKAGKLVTGCDRICDEIRRHGVPDETGRGGHGIVILASDASANTEKRLRNSCGYYNVAIHKADLSAKKLGEKTGRSDCAAIAVFDRDFKNGLSALFAGND